MTSLRRRPIAVRLALAGVSLIVAFATATPTHADPLLPITVIRDAIRQQDLRWTATDYGRSFALGAMREHNRLRPSAVSLECKPASTLPA